MVDPALIKASQNDTKVFDHKARQAVQDRIASNFDDYSFLQSWARGQIQDRLDDIRREFSISRNITFQDFNNDIEALNLEKESCELITSALDLHVVNDLPGALLQIQQSLKPDGLFIAAMFGGETLYELRESLMHAEMVLKGGVSPRVFPFADKQQMGGLLQRAGFALPVVDSEIITVTYENIFKLMHDLRGMGENNIINERSRLNPGKEFFMKAAQHYQDHFAESDGRIKASFEIIFLLGWAPHESQQKPLKPGSAKQRLSDALRTNEIKTGEKAEP